MWRENRDLTLPGRGANDAISTSVQMGTLRRWHCCLAAIRSGSEMWELIRPTRSNDPNLWVSACNPLACAG